MNVFTKISEKSHSALMDGPHSLSWAYLLDIIFSDAYHKKIEDLRFVTGIPEVDRDIKLRAEVTHITEKSDKTAVAQLVTRETDDQLMNADVVYTVEYGWLSSTDLRKWNPHVPVGMVLERQYSVFTWKARYFGIPIRLASILRQPHTFDRFMKRMRRVFLVDTFVPSYYHLKIWRKSV